MRVAVELVDNREPGILAVIIHAADVDKIIKAKGLPGKSAYVGDSIRVAQLQRDLATKFDGFRHEVGKLSAQPVRLFLGSHGDYATFLKGVAIVRFSTTGSLATFFCSRS